MTLDVTARINQVLFRSREPDTGDRDGFYIDDDGFEGWNDGSDIRRDETDRPQGHGSFDVPGFLSARVVSLSGTCWADTHQKLMWFRSQLTGLLADGAAGQIVVEEGGQTRWATCRLATRTGFAVRSEDIRSAEYQIQVWCANPRQFGETREFAGGIPAFHRGNFPAAPVHTVTGIGADYTINGPAGKQFTVTTPVTDGHPHTIDMATGFLEVDGAVVSGAVTQADVWSIPGGAQVTHTLTGPGLSLSTAVTDTYI